MSSLFERHRPRQWSEVVGQDKAIDSLKRLIDSGTALGRGYWLSGSSGTGKTTIARILASELADDLYIEERDAHWLTAARLDELERRLRYKPLMADKPGIVVIVNEAHRLRDEAVGWFLTAMERMAPWAVFIFTTTNDGEDKLFDTNDDSFPFVSRCFRVPLSRRGLAEPAARLVKAIAEREGLDGQPIEKYIRLAKDSRNSIRAMLDFVERGGMLAE